jgi:hypothetical protein
MVFSRGVGIFFTEEYRMQHRKFLLAAATIAAISPVVSYASSPEKTALNACANALASSVATSGSDAPGYQLKYRHSQSGPMDYYGHQYTFYLQARDARTGMPLGRVTCSADKHGTVVAWTPVPLGAPGPALAARF